MRVTESTAHIHLEGLCKKTSQREVAKLMGISPQYLNDLLFKRRDLTQLNPHALAAVGLRKQVTVEWDLDIPRPQSICEDCPGGACECNPYH